MYTACDFLLEEEPEEPEKKYGSPVAIVFVEMAVILYAAWWCR